MKLSPVLKMITILVALLGAFSTASVALAQDLADAPRKASNQPATSRTRTLPPRTITKIKTVEVRIPTLFVSARSKADIWIKPVSSAVVKAAECEGKPRHPLPAIGSDESSTGTVPENENFFISEALRPGCYRVVAALDGYKTDEKLVRIGASELKGVSLDLEPILYKVVISTNVEAGDVRYAPVEASKDPKTGEQKYRQVGLPRLVYIKNKTATLPELFGGTYGFDVNGGVDYEPYNGVVTVPGSDNRETIELPVKLNYLRSTATFSSLTADQWDLPASGNISKGLLIVKGSGVATPRLEIYRHYTDFEIVSDVRMINGMAASFVVHASAEKENYYLITLTGPNAAEPYRFSGFLVKNGVPQRLKSVSISHLKETIKPNKDFLVKITVKDNNIDVRINEAGKYVPLGVVVDPNRNFAIGAPGVAGGKDEQTQFGSFLVCSPQCPK